MVAGHQGGRHQDELTGSLEALAAGINLHERQERAPHFGGA
jgi:hypothetical protein